MISKAIPFLIVSILSVQVFAQSLIGEFQGMEEYENLGSSISLSEDGSVMALGATGFGNSQGRVVVYDNIEGQWIQKGEMFVGEPDEVLGIRVLLAADGNRIMIKSLVPGESFGQVKIYEWLDNQWSQMGSTLKNEQGLDLFGDGIAFNANANRIAIGSPQEHGPVETQVGSVRIYEWAEGDWVQIGQKIEGVKKWDYMGTSVDLSADGNRVALSLNGQDSDGLDGNGAVRVYEYDNTQWNEIGEELRGTQEKAKLGRTSVRLSADGNRLAYSGDWYGENGELFWGIVEVHEFDGGQWTQLGQSLKGVKGDWLGTAMDFSDDGETLLIGSDNEFARLYTLADGQWLQQAEDMTHEGESGGYGSSLALSGDGRTAVIGADGFHAVSNDEGLIQIFDLSEFSTSIVSPMTDKLIISPNPFKNEISIDGINISDIKLIRFFDLSGKWLFEDQPSNRTIRFSKQVSGIIHMQVFTETGMIGKKLVRIN